MDAEDALVLITCLVGIVCIIAVQSKQGIVLGSTSLSRFKKSSVKYVKQSEQRRPFYIALVAALVIILLVALSFTRDIMQIAFFVGFNAVSVSYFLSYFILLKPKGKIE